MLTTIRLPTWLRSSLANTALAVSERAPIGARDVLENAAEIAKWPFERAAWVIEWGLLWPLQKRFDNRELAVGSVGALTLALGAAAVLLWAMPPNKGSALGAGARSGPKIASKALPPHASASNHAPLLHGAAPVFAPPSGAAAPKIAGAKALRSASPPANRHLEAGLASISSAPAIQGKPAGPVAIAIARRFSEAFVFYETGQTSARVRATFASTATSALVHSLLKRPPRQPASVKVPKAKVLNVVAGPSSGGIYVISVSLLRIGVTSELRIEMEKAKHGSWHVTNVLG
jgi:hypothetical protein